MAVRAGERVPPQALSEPGPDQIRFLQQGSVRPGRFGHWRSTPARLRRVRPTIRAPDRPAIPGRQPAVGWGHPDGLIELFAGRDYLAGLTTEAKLQRLEKTSYRTFLTEIWRRPPPTSSKADQPTTGASVSTRSVPSKFEMMADGYPGAKALRLEGRTAGSPEDKCPTSIISLMAMPHSPYDALNGPLCHQGHLAQIEHGEPGHGPVRLCAARSSWPAGPHQTLIRLSCVCGIRPADRASRSVT